MAERTFRLLPEGDPVEGLSPSNMVAEEKFTGSDHTELIHNAFATPDESILSGVWVCAPCYEEIESYPVHEMMTIISGSLTVTNAEGVVETFTAGDTFFIPKGSKCTWHITETLRKFYMIADV